MRNSLLVVLLGVITCAPIFAAPKFPQSVSDDLKLDKIVLDTFHMRDAEEQYIEAEAAYYRAVGDLEDYQQGDPSITEERLTNDAWEVWADLAPYRNQMTHPPVPSTPTLKKRNDQ